MEKTANKPRRCPGCGDVAGDSKYPDATICAACADELHNDDDPRFQDLHDDSPQHEGEA